MKADQIDVLASPVLRDFEKVDDPVEPRTARERIQIRTLQVISPRRTPSRRRLVKTTAGFYNANRNFTRRSPQSHESLPTGALSSGRGVNHGVVTIRNYYE